MNRTLAVCGIVGVGFVILLLALGTASPAAADFAAALLGPGETLARLMGYAAHDLVGFLCVIPGNMLFYALIAYGLVRTLRKRKA